jgi:uncharacterized membrane protein YeiB
VLVFEAHTARGPVQRTERALAPDLARGAMLLFIALANCAGAFFASAPGVDTTPHGLERVYNLFMFTFVHARAYPMFAIMFGYGLVQLARRQDVAAGDTRAARSVLLRRNSWLFVFGAVHGVLLLGGDFLGGYGLVGIAFTLLLLRRGDRVYQFAPWYLAVVGVYMIVLPVVIALTNGTGGAAQVPTSPNESFAQPDYVASLLSRVQEWPVHTVTITGLIFVVWIGAWAARKRILEEPARHLRLLRVAAVGGIGLAVASGLPMGLFSAGVFDVSVAAAPWVKLLYEVSGTFGGVGYVALFGLLSHALTTAMPAPRESVVVSALTALGQRSLSGYLFQSVAWAVLAWPFMLDLGSEAASPTFAAAASATAVWLVSLVAAQVMQRRSYRGPAEVLLRQLVYRPDRAERLSTRCKEAT